MGQMTLLLDDCDFEQPLIPFDERCQVLDLLTAPIWIFDIEHSLMVWASGAALALWGASRTFYPNCANVTSVVI